MYVKAWFASELFPVIVPSSIHGSCLEICHLQPSGPVLLPRHTMRVGQAGEMPFMVQNCSDEKQVSLKQNNVLEICIDYWNVFNEMFFSFRQLKTSVPLCVCQQADAKLFWTVRGHFLINQKKFSQFS